MRLESVVRRWRRAQALAVTLRAVGTALGIGALTWLILPQGPFFWWMSVVFAVAGGVASLWVPRPPMADPTLVAKHLDRVVPELEDSAELIHRDETDLSGLERLQTERVSRVLRELPAVGLWPRNQLRGSLRALLGGVIVVLLAWVGSVQWADRVARPTLVQEDRPMALEQGRDPLAGIEVAIRPPAYTGRSHEIQSELELEVLAGSRIRWRLPGSDHEAFLMFAGQEREAFIAGDDGMGIEKTARENGIYRIAVGRNEDQVLSPYARLTVVPDEKPRVQFRSPRERVTQMEPSRDSLGLVLEAQDDHGLAEVDLILTLAQGSGELVDFRQLRRPVRPRPVGKDAVVETRLELSGMDLAPGTELYFHAEARDQRQPDPNVGRSATYILRVPAPETVSAELGEGLPIVLPPEYFRSQRQIILDTEKLIAEESDLSVTEFRRRAEGLGFDQRALRMRYGILLGEEFDSGRPLEVGQEDHGHEEDEEQDPFAGVPAELIHSHDSAEIATFFSSEIRSRLKQVLAQMWDAEGRLRVHQPEQALPFEYRALELLKNLQERSRIYVQKVGFETPPLEPEKLRLSGDLEDIRTRSRSSRWGLDDPLAIAALELLTGLQMEAMAVSPADVLTAESVRGPIGAMAAADASWVQALVALDRWVAGETLGDQDRQSLTNALWQLVPEPELTPAARRESRDPLAEMYRAALEQEAEP